MSKKINNQKELPYKRGGKLLDVTEWKYKLMILRNFLKGTQQQSLDWFGNGKMEDSRRF